MIKKAFCANCQSITDHVLTGRNEHIILTCNNCERFIKIPLTMTTEEMLIYLENHEKDNKGQIPAKTEEEIFNDEKMIESKLYALADKA